MGTFSKELCGGTHLDRTDEVGTFELVSDESVSAGTRRVIALTGTRAVEQRKHVSAIAEASSKLLSCTTTQLGQAAVDLMQTTRNLKKQLAGGSADRDASSPKVPVPTGTDYHAVRQALRQAARALNVGIDEVPTRIAAQLKEQEESRKQLELLTQSGQTSAEDLLEKSEVVSGVRVVIAETPGANPNLMRQWIDQIRKGNDENTAVLLASRSGDDKVTLVCGLSKSLVDRKMSAGVWITPVAETVAVVAAASRILHKPVARSQPSFLKH